MLKKYIKQPGAFMLVLVVITLAIFYIESGKVQPPKEPLSTEDIQALDTTLTSDAAKRIADKSRSYPKAPELVGITGYLNTDGNEIKIGDYLGNHVVLIDFWTYTCINCIRTLPYLVEWDDTYRDQGLVVIGVHTPEFEFEKEYDNVKNAIAEHNIQYAVVLDNNYQTWAAFKNRYWPRKYLIDKDGFIRYDHIGEGAYQKTELMIQKLLIETANYIG